MNLQARQPRSYGQFCPVASALDVVGDRWILLIMRELLFGRRRFSEIKRACTGIAPNLLSDRLRTLIDRGLVESAPSGYALTESGHAVRPVLRALARFGVAYLDPNDPAMPDPQTVSAESSIRSFITPYQRCTLPPIRVRVVGSEDDARDIVQPTGEPFAVIRPSSGDAEVTFQADVADLWRARRHRTPFSAKLTGEERAIRDFLQAFDLQDLAQR